MTNHPLDGVEPSIGNSTALLPDFVEDPGLRIQLSIAISLKRIADVLDGSAVGLSINETMFGQPYDTR